MRRAWLFVGLVIAGCDGGSGPGAASTGATGSGGSSTSATTTSTNTTSASGAGGASGACAACEGGCVDLANDALHCGACDHACPPQTLCDRGTCKPPQCDVVGPICPNDHLCCGGACCPPWKMCCNALDGGPPSCVPVDAGACPTSCDACP